MKKNVRKVSAAVAKKLKGLPRYVVAGVAKIYDLAGLERGLLKHIGVRVRRDGTLVPPEEGKVGRPSRRIRPIQQAQRRGGGCCPPGPATLETHCNSIDNPNWGDAATYGTHTVDLSYERYPREQIPPRLSVIKVTQADEGALRKPAPALEVPGLTPLGELVERMLSRQSVGRPALRTRRDLLLENLAVVAENLGIHRRPY